MRVPLNSPPLFSLLSFTAVDNGHAEFLPQQTSCHEFVFSLASCTSTRANGHTHSHTPTQRCRSREFNTCCTLAAAIAPGKFICPRPNQCEAMFTGRECTPLRLPPPLNPTVGGGTSESEERCCCCCCPVLARRGAQRGVSAKSKRGLRCGGNAEKARRKYRRAWP